MVIKTIISNFNIFANFKIICLLYYIKKIIISNFIKLMDLIKFLIFYISKKNRIYKKVRNKYISFEYKY